MTQKRLPLRPGTQIFIGMVLLTSVVWILRGLGIFSFLPGIVIWLLILLCFATGIINSLQRLR